MKHCFTLLLLFIGIHSIAFSMGTTKVETAGKFKNSNHPQIAYWFLTNEILENEKYLPELDNIIDHSLFDLIFLDCRNGPSFSNVAKMHPILEKIVARAHSRNVKIGFRTHRENNTPPADEDAERSIAEAETVLDHSGKGSCSLDARFMRSQSSYKKEVYRIFVFKKTADGFYDPSSLREITDFTSSVKEQTIQVKILAGKDFGGYTAYVLGGFYYRSHSNFSPEAVDGTIKFIDNYADIPFDGVMLDEYGNAQVIPPWQLMFRFGSFRLRSLSPAMVGELESLTGEKAGMTMLHMRYAPSGQPEIRAKAINVYMDLMRQGPMHVENAMFRKAKEVYGKNCFVGAHNTFHNSLIKDEIWDTGVKWWSIPREYGFTDEHTPTPTQMGIAMSYPAKAMYNMYYDSKIKRFTTKTLTDLRYGIRTFYHAFNDKQWGIGLEQPEAVGAITPVEKCARLMNLFNPSLPDIKLLVIFGNEALQNWYPKKSERGRYDINDQLKIEEKALKIWKAGYRNALVPTDLISEGKLKLGPDHKPVLNGHTFDAVLFLYPQYSKEPVLRFLEEYVGNGGKLMIEGNGSCDFEGNDISDRIKNIQNKAAVTGFSVRKIPKLGIEKNEIKGGCKNEDGSYLFTDIRSLRNRTQKTFSITSGKDNYSVECTGFAAISAGPETGLTKLACSGFTLLRRNGAVILKTDHPADIFLEKINNQYNITLEGQAGTSQIVTDKLHEQYPAR